MRLRPPRTDRRRRAIEFAFASPPPQLERRSKTSGRAVHTSRSGPDTASERLQQVEEARLGPVDVLEDDDERPRPQIDSR